MKIREGLIIFGLVLLWIVLSPIWIPFFAFVYIDQKIDDYRFRKYLAATGDKNFFCYTNKQSSQQFVENNVIPFLPADVEVLFVSSKRLIDLRKKNGFPDRIIGKMRELKKGFPCVAKISGGRLITESVNHEIYEAIQRKKDPGPIVEKISRFFDGS